MPDKLLKNRPLKKAILGAVDNLPPTPNILHKARAIIADPNSSFKELEKLIINDQAFAVKIIKIANSSYYGRVKKVSSIQDATVIIGMKNLSELITIASASSLFKKTLIGYELPARAIWRHSIGVAFGAKIIAGMKYPALADDAFSAGLIHDVGKLILDEYVYERKEAFQEFMYDGQQTFLEAEKEILGFEHAEIAAKVCKKWNFPKSITVAIRYHHQPSRLMSNKLAHIIHVADQITESTGMDIDGITLESSGNSLEVVGLQIDEIAQLMDEITEYVDQVGDTVGGS
ncbi:MAG: HDOD domain-containing protein [Desulfobacteraceae bacterium]|nr:HDOD domain-containing protein [Desulfobacteraceae bacterium]